MMKNFKFILTLMFACTIVLMTNAQDLIKDTRNGIQYSAAKKTVEPNNIAKKVRKTFENNSYTTSKVFTLEKNQKQLVAKNRADVEDAVYLTLNKSEVAKVVKSSPNALKLQLPVTETNNIELALIKNDFLADGFKITTSEGKEFDISDRALFYKGYVNGDPTSLAAITIFDGKISGTVSDKNGNYDLGAKKDNENQTIFYNGKYLKGDTDLSCGTNDFSVNETQLKANKTAIAGSNQKRNAGECVGIYFEVAKDFYDFMGSSEAAVTEYLTKAFNATATVFEQEGMKICMSSISILTTGNNYNTDNGADLIVEFDNRMANIEYPGNIPILIYHVNGGAGLAYGPGRFGPDGTLQSVLCAGGQPALAVIGFMGDLASFPTSSRDGLLLAHEIGHTFGSYHTHACQWNVGGLANQALDGCAATENHQVYNPNTGVWDQYPCSQPAALAPANASIMSYCWVENGVVALPLSNGFGPQPKALMQNHYNTAIAQGCLMSNSNPSSSCNNAFAAYAWLSSTITANTCTQITEYFYSADWNFLYVVSGNVGRLYLSNGSDYGTDSGDGSILGAYGLTTITNQWSCGCGGQNPVSGCTDANACNYNPQATNNDGSCEYNSCNPTSSCDAAFGAYNWLMGVVPPNVCTQITEYYYSVDWNFIYMVSGNVATLYLSNGSVYGSDAGDGSILGAYGLTIITNQWSCGCGGFRVLDELKEDAFLIMPNPNNGQFDLVLSKTINQEDAKAEIYSINGKKMKTIDLNKAMQQSIDVADFSSGLYLLKLTSDSYASTQRFTIR